MFVLGFSVQILGFSRDMFVMVASKMFLNKVFSHVVVPDERLIQQAPGLGCCELSTPAGTVEIRRSHG